MTTPQDDRIFWSTRVLSAVIVPFLLLAFIILYLFPNLSGHRFAWEIRPHMMALLMGAGYLGGAWLFLNVIFGRHWHRVGAGFLPVTSFTIAMLLATVLHWNRFNIKHFPFDLWLGLYIATPVLVPWMWLHNRVTDPGSAEAGDRVVPLAVRWGLGLLCGLPLALAMAGFIAPDLLIQVWSWKLPPLTARVLGGWFSLLGVGGIALSRDARWSAWRVPLQSITLWTLLVLIGAVCNQTDFTGGLLNWYMLSIASVLAGIAVLYVYMAKHRNNPHSSPPAD